MFENTKAFCSSFLELGVPGFDLAVYRDGECVLRHMGGCSDREKGIAVKGDELYHLYSCSKPITCTAALQLWEKGLFSLEDRLSDYMPEFAEMYVKTEGGLKKAEKPILIRHLFEMTAGFSYDLQSPSLERARLETGGRCPTRETMSYLAREPLLFEPGDRWEYSLCHDVLAALVEVISGRSFDSFVKENIFSPLGMDSATYLPDAAMLNRLAPQYQRDLSSGMIRNCGKNNRYRLGSEYAAGGAGCVATVDDYMKFVEALRSGERLLKRSTVELMCSSRLTASQERSYWMNVHHGYGLGVRTPREGSIFTDFGWGGAAGAFLAVDMENRLSIYLSMHTLSSPAQGIRERVYLHVMAELMGREDFAALAADSSFSGDYRYTF